MPRAALVLALLPATACGGAPTPSFAERAAAQASEPAVPVAEPAPAAGPDGTPTPAEPSSSPPPGAERIALALALPEATTYEITTLGMVQLPLLEKPTGFARRERITVDRCSGSGFDRRCRLRQRVTNFEAEPPAGGVLERDEARLIPIESEHAIAADGRRLGTTTLHGEPARLAAVDAAGLAELHRFFCLRFPSEPVAVTAKWQDSCVMRSGGAVVEREVVWELVSLVDDPGGSGKRAELHVAGGQRSVDRDGKAREGTVQGVLYFRAGLGEPHRYVERTTMFLDAERKRASVTTTDVQFAKVLPGPPERVVGTDGRPRAEPAANEAAALVPEQGVR